MSPDDAEREEVAPPTGGQRRETEPPSAALVPPCLSNLPAFELRLDLDSEPGIEIGGLKEVEELLIGEVDGGEAYLASSSSTLGNLEEASGSSLPT